MSTNASGALPRLGTALLLALAAGLGRPSPTTADDLQEWTTLEATSHLGERFIGALMLQERFDDDISRAQVFLVRPSLDLILTPNVQIGIGYDYFDGLQQGVASENRIWQQFTLGSPIGGLDLSHRFRISERFIEGTDGPSLRQRYRLLAEKWVGADKDWLLYASNEIFFNMTEQPGGPATGFDQDRLNAGLGYLITPTTRLQGGYQWLVQKGKENGHALMLSVRLDLTGLFAKE